MVKIINTLLKPGPHQFFIRKSFLPIWVEFIKLINKDDVFNKKVNDEEQRGNPSRVSRAITLLIYNYVFNKNPEFFSDSEEQDNSEEEKIDENIEENNKDDSENQENYEVEDIENNGEEDEAD